MKVSYKQDKRSLGEFMYGLCKTDVSYNNPESSLAKPAIALSEHTEGITEDPTMSQYIGFTATMTLAMGESVAITEAIQHNNATTGAIAGVGAAALIYSFARTFKEIYGPLFSRSHT